VKRSLSIRCSLKLPGIQIQNLTNVVVRRYHLHWAKKKSRHLNWWN